MNTRIMDTLTGLFRPRGDAKLDPKGTVEVTINRPQFNKSELVLLRDALAAYPDAPAKLLAKIDGMLG